jgi:hypothetical protein
MSFNYPSGPLPDVQTLKKLKEKGLLPSGWNLPFKRPEPRDCVPTDDIVEDKNGFYLGIRNR